MGTGYSPANFYRYLLSRPDRIQVADTVIDHISSGNEKVSVKLVDKDLRIVAREMFRKLANDGVWMRRYEKSASCTGSPIWTYKLNRKLWLEMKELYGDKLK